jgi:hypothetical protein
MEFFEEPGVINDSNGAMKPIRVPTVLCAALTQVMPHELLGVPELSELQAPVHLPGRPRRVLGYFHAA